MTAASVAGVVIAALTPELERLAYELLGILVRMVGGADRVRMMLDAQYSAADAGVDVLEEATLAARAALKPKTTP